MKLDRSIPNKFYELIMKIPQKDLRLGQFFINLEMYIRTNYSKDPFYLENEEYVKLMEEYIKTFCVIKGE